MKLFAVLANVLYCHRCGADNAPGSVYCGSCGGMLNP